MGYLFISYIPRKVLCKVSRDIYRKVFVRSHATFFARFYVRSHATFFVEGSQTLSGFSNLSKYFMCRISHYFFRDFIFYFFHTNFILVFENLELYFIEFICRIIHNNMRNCAFSIYYANWELRGEYSFMRFIVTVIARSHARSRVRSHVEGSRISTNILSVEYHIIFFKDFIFYFFTQIYF